MIISPTENINRVETEMVINKVEKSAAPTNHYNNLPKHIQTEVRRYTLDHSTKDAIEKFSKEYRKFTFKRTWTNSWETSLKNSGDRQTFNKKGRQNLLSETLLTKKKGVIFGSCLAGTVISRRVVIAIGTGVIKANDAGETYGSLRSKHWTKNYFAIQEKNYLYNDDKQSYVVKNLSCGTLRFLFLHF